MDTGQPTTEHREPVKGASEFGMWLFIAALGMLFAASLIGYLVIRIKSPQWVPPDAHPLPLALYFSTFVLIGSSLTMHGALDSARRDRQNVLRLMTGGTLLLGIIFLLSQTYSWLVMISAHAGLEPSLYLFTFYTLTALHALHVVCGIIPLTVTTIKACRGTYNSKWNLPVKLMGMYWHFLLVVWMVMFTVMVVAS